MFIGKKYFRKIQRSSEAAKPRRRKEENFFSEKRIFSEKEGSLENLGKEAR